MNKNPLRVIAVLLIFAATGIVQASNVFRVSGNGSNDTAELQAAFDAASAAGAGAVVELAGKLYTDALRIEGFHGTVRGAAHNPPTIDVLRGLDPTLPGVTLRIGNNGNPVAKPLFEFVDSTVKMRGPLTFHITAANPSDPHPHGPAGIPTTELGNIIRFAGTSDADVSGIVMRGAPGSIEDLGGSWNVRVGIAFFTSEPIPFGDPTFGNVSVRNSSFEKLLIAISSDSLVGGRIRFDRNTLDECAFCLIASNSSGAIARYTRNRLTNVIGFGLLAVQISEPGVGSGVPISAPTTVRVIGNTIDLADGAIAGLNAEDVSRDIHGLKTLDMTVAANDISGGSVGGLLSFRVQDLRVIGNHFAGNWFVGVDAFLGADNCTVLGNTFGRSRHTGRSGIATAVGAVSLFGSSHCDVLLNRFVDVTGSAVVVPFNSGFNRVRFNDYRESGIPACAIVLEGDNNVVTEHAFPPGTDATTQVCNTGSGNVVH